MEGWWIFWVRKYLNGINCLRGRKGFFRNCVNGLGWDENDELYGVNCFYNLSYKRVIKINFKFIKIIWGIKNVI